MKEFGAQGDGAVAAGDDGANSSYRRCVRSHRSCPVVGPTVGQVAQSDCHNLRRWVPSCPGWSG